MSGRERRGCKTHTMRLGRAALCFGAAPAGPPPGAVHTFLLPQALPAGAELAVVLSCVAQVVSGDCCLSELGTL